MKSKLVTITCLLFTVFGFAQEKNKKMTFEVDGKCEMCKTRIEKAVMGISGVKFAEWYVPTHQLSIIFDERKTNAMKVKMALAAVGHDTKELKATQEAYDKIHPCCKYRSDSAEDKHPK